MGRSVRGLLLAHEALGSSPNFLKLSKGSLTCIIHKAMSCENNLWLTGAILVEQSDGRHAASAGLRDRLGIGNDLEKKQFGLAPSRVRLVGAGRGLLHSNPQIEYLPVRSR